MIDEMQPLGPRRTPPRSVSVTNARTRPKSSVRIDHPIRYQNELNIVSLCFDPPHSCFRNDRPQLFG